MLEEKPDYTYIFDDITDQPSRVWVFEHRSKTGNIVTVKVVSDHLSWWSARQMVATVADLVAIGAAVYVADRLSIRPKEQGCTIKVVLPVRCPELLRETEVTELLSEVLFWFTGDNWQFEFKNRCLERQMLLPVDVHKHFDEVCLWSGGLDSLAGLLNRLRTYPDRKYLLFGTGGSKYIHGLQSQIAKGVSSQFPGHTQLVQVPINLRNPGKLPHSSSQRSRGFVFLLLGAVCAYLGEADSLCIYENGVGAINLPYRAAEVGLEHARSVHPHSLLLMANLISYLLKKPFSFHNPFQYWTKAQMCEVFMQEALINLVSRTVSCDRRLRQRKQPIQCGRCSSCLLRRQALAANHLPDRTDYMVMEPTREDEPHLAAMLYQVDVFDSCFKTDDPWQSIIRRHLELHISVAALAKQENVSTNVIKERVLQLYRNYVEEWRRAGLIGEAKQADNEEADVVYNLPLDWERRCADGWEHPRHHRPA